MNYLLTANLCVWFGIGIYLFFLHATQKRLARRMAHLEMLHEQ